MPATLAREPAMVRPPYPIAILGAGKIGAAIALLLQRGGDYDILVADQDQRLQAVARLGCRTAAGTR